MFLDCCCFLSNSLSVVIVSFWLFPRTILFYHYFILFHFSLLGQYIDSGTQRATIATDLLWADVCTGDEDAVLDKQGGFGPNERGEELVVCFISFISFIDFLH
jgi:hypothetical protein